MAKSKLPSADGKPQPAPRSYALTGVRITRRDDYDLPGRSTGGTEAPEDVALALDFVGRLLFKRTSDEGEAWATGATLSHYLSGLSELVALPRSEESSLELETFLAEALEYAAIRVAIALDGPARRMARWRVTLEPAPKAVAS